MKNVAAILDDDGVFGELLKEQAERLFRKYGLDISIDVFTSPDELNRSTNTYPLFFVDIVLPEVDGITIVQEWQNQGKVCEVIYVSAYDHHVFRTFRSHPIAYVRKSFLDADLAEAISLYVEHRNAVRVALPEGQKTYFMNPKEILYLSSNNHYIEIHRWDGEVKVLRGKLDDMEQILEAHGFIRIHASYLLNWSYISAVERTQIQLKNNERYKISLKYRAHVYQQLEAYFTKGVKHDA